MSVWGHPFLRADGDLPPPRRQALLRMAPEMVLSLLHNLNREDHRVTIDGLPADARVAGAGYEIGMDAFVLRLESEEFEPIPEGGMFPYINPTLTEHFLRPAEEATS